MHYFIAVFLLFFFLFFLVLLFHSPLWDSSWSDFEGFRSWVSGFECGFLSQRLVENYFSSTYFMLLVFFVVFDLEVSLLLNMPIQGICFKNLTYYYFFLFLLLLGFGGEIYKGYVNWGF